MSHGAERVVLLGATGFTGGLVLERLEAAGVECVLAGRRASRLEAIADRHDHVADVRVVDVEDEASVGWLGDPDLLVLSCVGPFNLLGRGVLSAVAHGGGRYVDVTGEEPFVAFAQSQCASPAERSGALLVQACAFESLLSDLLAERLCPTGAEVRSIASFYGLDGHALSPGTALTMRLARHWETSAFEDGAFIHRAPGSRVQHITLPFLPGRSRAVFAPYPEIRFWPARLVTRHATSWVATTPTEARLTGSRGRSRRSSIDDEVARHRRRERRGPNPAERLDQAFTVGVVAVDERGRARAEYVSGRDPYGLTASIVAWVAERLLSGDADGIRGVRAPAELFDPEEFFQTASSWEFGITRGSAEGMERDWISSAPDRR